MTTQPTEDFLFQLQERLALNEDAAVSTLAAWLSSYEPGPVARARQGALRRGARDSSAPPRARRPSTWPR